MPGPALRARRAARFAQLRARARAKACRCRPPRRKRHPAARPRAHGDHCSHNPAVGLFRPRKPGSGRLPRAADRLTVSRFRFPSSRRKAHGPEPGRRQPFPFALPGRPADRPAASRISGHYAREDPHHRIFLPGVQSRHPPPEQPGQLEQLEQLGQLGQRSKGDGLYPGQSSDDGGFFLRGQGQGVDGVDGAGEGQGVGVSVWGGGLGGRWNGPPEAVRRGGCRGCSGTETHVFTHRRLDAFL